ncbi:MAG: FxsA family protein [Rhodobacteraceae bacterium]|nr:FxsA family protein [Paracoccaceae bacterium]MCP5341417.1 FxsA family protein [Paracoccaceae bacterium]
MWLFIAFLAVPLIEIGLFIQVGGIIGLWPTLAIVLGTALAGSWLVRKQGAATIARLRGSLSELRDPTEPIAHGAMILFAGALLLTPGFFTDAVGLLLLVPAVRSAVLRYLASRVHVQSFTVGGGATHRAAYRDDVIDGEYSEIEPKKTPLHRPGGPTLH